jgi:hypothetical protein
MDGIGDEQVKRNKSESERQISCFLSYVESEQKKEQRKKKT